MWNRKEERASCGWQPYLDGSFLGMRGVCVHACDCTLSKSLCVASPSRSCGIRPRTGSSMWVNCDLAISLPGGDKSSPCWWCVNHSVITSSCHDCLRMQASGNLHCRSFTDTGGKNTQRLFHSAQRQLKGVSHQMSRCREN